MSSNPFDNLKKGKAATSGSAPSPSVSGNDLYAVKYASVGAKEIELLTNFVTSDKYNKKLRVEGGLLAKVPILAVMVTFRTIFMHPTRGTLMYDGVDCTPEEFVRKAANYDLGSIRSRPRGDNSSSNDKEPKPFYKLQGMVKRIAIQVIDGKNPFAQSTEKDRLMEIAQQHVLTAWADDMWVEVRNAAEAIIGTVNAKADGKPFSDGRAIKFILGDTAMDESAFSAAYANFIAYKKKQALTDGAKTFIDNLFTKIAIVNCYTNPSSAAWKAALVQRAKAYLTSAKALANDSKELANGSTRKDYVIKELQALGMTLEDAQKDKSQKGTSAAP